MSFVHPGRIYAYSSIASLVQLVIFPVVIAIADRPFWSIPVLAMLWSIAWIDPPVLWAYLKITGIGSLCWPNLVHSISIRYGIVLLESILALLTPSP